MGNCVSLQLEGGEDAPDVQQVQDASPSAKRLRASASSAYLRQSSRDGVNLLLRPSPSAHSISSVRSTARGAPPSLSTDMKARRSSATPPSSAPSQTLLTNQHSTPPSCRRSSLPLSPEGSPAYHPLAPSPTVPTPTPATTCASNTSSTIFHKSTRDSAVSVSAPHTPPQPTVTAFVRGSPTPAAQPTFRPPSSRKPVSHSFTLPSPYDSLTDKGSEQPQQPQQQQQQAHSPENNHSKSTTTCTTDAPDRAVAADTPLPSRTTGSNSMPSSPFALAQRGLQFVDMDNLHEGAFLTPPHCAYGPPGPACGSPKAISSPSNLASGDGNAEVHQPLAHTTSASAAAPAAAQSHEGLRGSLSHKPSSQHDVAAAQQEAAWLAVQQEAARAKQAELERSDSAGLYGGGGCGEGVGRVVGVVPGCEDAEAEWFVGVGGKVEGVSAQWQQAKLGQQGACSGPQGAPRTSPQEQAQQRQRAGSDQSGYQVHSEGLKEGSGCLGSQRASWAPQQQGSIGNAPAMGGRHTSAFSYHGGMRASSTREGSSVPEAMPSADWRSMHMAMAVAAELGESVPLSPESLAHAASKEERRSTGHSSSTMPYAPLFAAGGPALKRIASTGSHGHRATSLTSDMRLSSCGTGLRLSRNTSSTRTTPNSHGSSRPSPNTLLPMTSGTVRTSPSSNNSAAAADAVAALTDAFTGRKSARVHAESAPDVRKPQSQPQHLLAPTTAAGAVTQTTHTPPPQTDTTLPPINTGSTHAHAPVSTNPDMPNKKAPHHPLLPTLAPVSESPHSLVASDGSVNSMTNNVSGSNGGAGAYSGPLPHAHHPHAASTANAAPHACGRQPALPHINTTTGVWDSRASRMAAHTQSARSSNHSACPVSPVPPVGSSSPVCSAWEATPHTPVNVPPPPRSPLTNKHARAHERAPVRAKEGQADEEVIPGEPGCAGGFSPVSESIRVADPLPLQQPRLPHTLTVRMPNNAKNSNNNSNAMSGCADAESCTSAVHAAGGQQQQHSSAQQWEECEKEQQRAAALLVRSTTCARSSAPPDISPFCHLAAAAHARVHGAQGSPHTQAHVQGGCGRDAATLLANSQCASALSGLLPHTQHQPLPPFMRYLNRGGRSSAAAPQGTGAQASGPGTPQQSTAQHTTAGHPHLAQAGCEGAGVGAPHFGGSGGSDFHALRASWVASTPQAKQQQGCSPHAQGRAPPPLYTSASVRDEHEMLALQGFFSPRSPSRASLSPSNGGFHPQPGPWQ